MEGLNGSYHIASMDVSGNAPEQHPFDGAVGSDGVVPNTREPPNRPWPPEPGVRVTPAAGAAPVPLTTPRESVPRRTGRARHRTVFRVCQGLFSEKPEF